MFSSNMFGQRKKTRRGIDRARGRTDRRVGRLAAGSSGVRPLGKQYHTVPTRSEHGPYTASIRYGSSLWVVFNITRLTARAIPRS